MNKLLLYVNSGEREVTVLEIDGDEASEIVEECGWDLADWPQDLGAYYFAHGLLIWEGEIDGEEFNGTLRTLSEEEWDQVRKNLSPIS